MTRNRRISPIRHWSLIVEGRKSPVSRETIRLLVKIVLVVAVSIEYEADTPLNEPAAVGRQQNSLQNCKLFCTAGPGAYHHRTIVKGAVRSISLSRLLTWCVWLECLLFTNLWPYTICSLLAEATAAAVIIVGNYSFFFIWFVSGLKSWTFFVFFR